MSISELPNSGQRLKINSQPNKMKTHQDDVEQMSKEEKSEGWKFEHSDGWISEIKPEKVQF